MHKSKKSQSEVITTVLIILLVLVAVFIVYTVVRVMISRGTEQATISPLDISLTTARTDLSKSLVNISVSRQSGAGNLSAIIIIFKNSAGAEVCRYENRTNLPSELETRVYVVNLTNCSGRYSYDVYPVIKSGSKEIIGLKAAIEGGTSTPACTDECSSGQIRCNVNINQTCGNYDADSCLEWGGTVQCQYECSNGQCTSAPPTCTNKCSPQNSTQCSVNINQTCGDYYADSCLEWGNNDTCSDCSCKCGGYGKSNEIGYCSDGIDNDCDGKIDGNEVECMPSGLISWWRFEGNAYDEKGVHNGTILGNTNCSSAGKKGFGCYFDGNGDYVDAGIVSELNGKTLFTISVWINTSRTGIWNYFIARYSPHYWYDYIFLTVNSDNKIYFSLSQKNESQLGREVYSTQTINANQWQHVVAVVDADSAQVYLNGVAGTKVSLNLGAYPLSSGSAEPYKLFIGKQLYSDDTTPKVNNYFNGTIDNAMIFNRTLNVSEIQSIYNYQM